MKKILSTALILTLSGSILATPVFANESDTKLEPRNVFHANQQVELDLLEGAIKEIRDNELIVEDFEGKEYIVPILGFKDLEEYKNANIKVGQNISLKGNKLPKLEKGILIGESKDGLKNIAISRTEIMQDSQGVQQDLDTKMIIKNIDLEDSELIGEGFKIINLEGAETAEKGPIRIRLQENIDKEKLQEWKERIDVVKIEKLAEGIDKEKIKELRLEVISEDSRELMESVKVNFEDHKDMVKIVAPMNGDIFLAQQITVDGTTIEVPNVTRALITRPVKTIEAEQ